MRLTELGFHRVGHWAELQPIRLGPRITLVLGDNEAGKTTAMRAVEALLFGPEKDLVLPLRRPTFHASAAALLAEGDELRWAWRNGTFEGDLERLRRAAPAETASRFRELFRLGQAQVRADPKVFLSDEGAIGRVLFAASAGAQAANLAGIEANLSKSYSEAISSAEKHHGLAWHLARCRERREALERAARFDAHDAEHARVAELRRILEVHHRRYKEADDALRRLESFARGLPRYTELDQTRAALAAIAGAGAGAGLGASWGADVELALERYRAALETAEASGLEVAEAETRLNALPPVPPIFAFAARIEALERETAGMRKDRQAHRAAHEEAAEARRALRELLAELGATPAEPLLVETARGLIVARSRRGVFEDRRKDRRQAEEEWDAARAAVQTATREVALAEKQAAEAAAVPVEQLEQAQELLTPLIDLERERSRLAQEDAAARKLAAQALAGLGLIERRLEEVASFPVADRASLDLDWKRLDDARQAEAKAQGTLENATKLMQERAREARALRESLGAPPTAEELARARAERQAAWDAVKRKWSPVLQPDAERDLPALGATFEKSALEADAIADRRFADAERIGKLQSADRAAREAADEAGLEQARTAALGEARAGAEKAWEGLWSFLPRPPADHQKWLADHSRVLEQAHKIAQGVSATKALEEELGRCRKDLASLLARVLPEAAALESPAAISAAIEVELQRRTKLNARAQSLTHKVETQRDNLLARESALQQAQQRFEESCARWDEVARTLPEGIGTSPAEVEQWLKRQDQLEQHCNRLVRAISDAQTLEAEIGAYDADATALLAECRAADPALGLSDGLAPGDLVGELGRLVRSARLKSEDREKAETSLAQRRVDHGLETKRLEARRAELETRWRQTGADGEWSEAKLAEAASRAKEAHALDETINRLNKELAREWPMGIDAALEEIGGRSLDALEFAIKELADTRQQIDQERLNASGEHAKAANELEKLTGEQAGQLPVDPGQELENARGRALEKTEEAVALKAALWLLKQAKQRAAESSRPLIEAASKNFEMLTDGLYRGLLIDRSEKEPELLALLASGGDKPVSILSDGTQDQIWLALRLAVAREAAKETPFPLLLDDVFVHFDDARTTAALRLLRELSSELQIILFTHHDHVLDLARAAIPDVLSEVVLARPDFAKRPSALPAHRQRHERPEAPVGLFPDGDEDARPKRRSAAGEEVASACECILAALVGAKAPMSKSEIEEWAQATRGMEFKPLWGKAIKELKDQGRIIQTGDKRGARYELSPDAGEASEDDQADLAFG